MKGSQAIILTGFFVSVGWIIFLGFSMTEQIIVDGIMTSAIIVTIITIIFSIISYFLFSLISKNIRMDGILLSVIIGVITITPLKEILGPIAAILIGIAKDLHHI